MRDIIQLPVKMSRFTAYNSTGSAGIVANENPEADNWYFNRSIHMQCDTRFYKGYTSPEIIVYDTVIQQIPFIHTWPVPNVVARHCLRDLVHANLEEGNYVLFSFVDDYYIEGKSWYHQRHFGHDGIISGVNEREKTYTITAYDSQWIYNTFDISQSCLLEALEQGLLLSNDGEIMGAKASMEPIPLDLAFIKGHLELEANRRLEDFAEDATHVFGSNALQACIVQYLERLKDGRIPSNRMDRRVFRWIWEYKKCMLDRIRAVEKALELSDTCSREYEPLVKLADNMRFLYTCYERKRDVSLLASLQDKLMDSKDKESIIFADLCGKM